MKPTNADDPQRTTEHSPSSRSTQIPTDGAPIPECLTHDGDLTAESRSEKPTPAQVAMPTVPGYVIEKVLGRGGMGVVYQARHLSLKRTVALKMVLAGSHAGTHELARFRIEAVAVARLQHPNIVQIHEVGEADGHPYCALEFVEGGNLASKLDGKPMPAREAAELVEALARAMQLAHSRNVVHRDLKPANILLAPDGTPKITDFGLARQMDSDGGETQAGTVMGTPWYMAPEQASGRAHEAGPAADIYALGAILYDCLAGRPPFKAKTIIETLDQVRTQEPTPPSRWQASVPLDLDTICLKCLRKEPENRYASAAELADELVRFLRGEPVLARPVGSAERVWRWCRRNRAVASLMATVFLVLVAGIAMSLWQAAIAREEKRRADEKAVAASQSAAEAKTNETRAYENALLASANEVTANNNAVEAKNNAKQANDEKSKADAARLEAEDRLVRLHIATGLRLVEDGDLLGALPWLAEALRRERDPNRAALHRRRFAAVLRHCPRLLNLWTTNVYEAHPSPDGRHILARSVSDGFTTLATLDAFTGKTLYEPLRMPMRTAAKFSPDGSRFLTIEDYLPRDVTLQLRDTLTGKSVGPPITAPVLEVNVSFTTDGKRLLTIHIENLTERNFRLWELATGRDVTPDVLRAHRPQLFMRAMGGDLLATITNAQDPSRMEVHTWRLSDGKPIGEPFRPARDDKPQRFSGAIAPDGSRLMIGQGRVASVFDMAKGLPVRLPFTITTSEEITHSQMFLGGARLVTVTAAGTHWWDARNGALLRTWRRGREGEEEVSYSDDGRLVLFHNNATTSAREQTRVWDWQADEPASPLLRHAGPISAHTFLPDGRRLLTLHRTGSDLTRGDLCLWDLMPVPPAPISVECWTDRLGRACLSKDGSRVVAKTPEGFHVHETATGKPLGLPIKGDPIGAAFSDNGRFLMVTFGKPRQVQLFDLDEGKAGKPIPLRAGLEVLADVAVSPDGTRASLVRVTGKDAAAFTKFGDPPTVELWDTVNGQLLSRLVPPLERDKVMMVKNVGFSPDGQRVVAVIGEATRDETPGGTGIKLPGRFYVRQWDASGQSLPAPPLSGGLNQEHFNLYLLGQLARQQRYLAFTPDSQRMVLSFGGARAYLTNGGEKDVATSLVHQNLVGLVTFSPDGRHVLTASDDQTARVWNTATGKPAGPPLDHGSPVKWAAFGLDGLVATVGGDGTVRVWDAIGGTPLTPRFRPPGAKTSPGDHETVQVTFTKDGQRLLVITQGRIWGYDLTPDPRDANDLMRLASLLSGRRIDETGAALTPLDSTTLRTSWESLVTKYPNGLGVGQMARSDLLNWHQAQAAESIASGDWTAAAHHWGHRLRADPREGSAWRGRGMAHSRLGLHTLALEDYRRAAALDDKDAEAWHGAGLALAALGRHADAVLDYSKAIKAGRKGKVNLDRADAYAEQEMWAEAVDDFHEGVKAGNDSAEMWHKAGLVFVEMGVDVGYHAACAWFTHQFSKQVTADRAKHVAWMCSLHSRDKAFYEALAAFPKMVKMSKDSSLEMFRAVCEGARNFEFDRKEMLRIAGDPGFGGPAHSPLVANAFLCYRLGQYKTVVEVLTQEPPRLLKLALDEAGRSNINDLAPETRRSLGLDGSPWEGLLLSMALSKLDRRDEAKKALEGALATIKTGKYTWPERLELKRLQREAEALLNPPKK